MTLAEIKTALAEGKRVFQHHKGYEVLTGFYDDGEQWWHITCLQNDYTIGLTWRDGTTMNGKENEFFIEGEQ
jgi:hypothetical protein